MSLTLNDVNNAIATRGVGWKAAQTPITNLTQDEMKHKLGWHPGSNPAEVSMREQQAANNAHNIKTQRYASRFALAIPSAAGLPIKYDLQNVLGVNYVTPIRDQGLCGSCVAFGTIAAVECQLQLTASNIQSPRDLSDADLFFCIGPTTGATCDDGWDVPDALDGFRSTGVLDEICFLYTDHDQPCVIICPPADRQRTKINDWRQHARIVDMKSRIVNKGPLITCLSIYEDFRYYKSGIYSRVSDVYLGGHCVCCVGYNDNEQCWICKNSWGTGWGEAGFFRIAYGECGIDANMWGIEI